MTRATGVLGLALAAGVLAGTVGSGGASAGSPGQPHLVAPLERHWWADVVISPDSSTIVYRTVYEEEDGDSETYPPFRLYSAQASGGSPVELAGSDLLGTTIGRPVVTPDGSTVVFVADPDERLRSEIFAVPIGGGPATRLTNLAGDGMVVRGTRVLVSPDSRWVVFRAGPPRGGRAALYAVPTDGAGRVVRLSPSTEEHGERALERETITADSTRVVFLLNEEDDAGPDVVLSVPIDGSESPMAVTSALVDPTVGTFALTPDGGRVVMSVDQDADGVYDLFSVGTDGRELVRLTPPMGEGGALGPGFALARDDGSAVYQADLEGDGLHHLYRVPLAGGPSTRITPARVTGDLASWSVSQTGDQVIYSSDAARRGRYELFAVPLAGGSGVRLNGDLVAGGDVLGSHLSPDGSWVIYAADERTNNVREMFMAPTGGGPSTPLEMSVSGTQPRFASDSSMALLTPWPTLVAAAVDPPAVVTVARAVTGVDHVVIAPNSAYAVMQADGGLYVVELPARCKGELATITGTAGPDTLLGTEGRDVIAGLGGDDHISGLAGGDLICGGPGDDRIDGGAGRDSIFGQRGSDTLRGGDGSDRMSGGSGDDTIHGEGSNDVISGGRGNDGVFGGPGDDVLYGNKGNDLLSGGKGRDQLRGGMDDDRLRGRSGNDRLFGNTGKDDLDGGSGVDRCSGGPGVDAANRCEAATTTP